MLLKRPDPKDWRAEEVPADCKARDCFVRRGKLTMARLPNEHDIHQVGGTASSARYNVERCTPSNLATSATDLLPCAMSSRACAICAAPSDGRGPNRTPRALAATPARAGALGNQRPLEIGDAGKYGEHHASGWGGGIGPRFGDGAQTRAGLLDALGDLQKVTGRTGEAVQTGDGDHVPGAQMIEQPCQCRAVALGAADLLLEDPAAPGGSQCGALLREVLALGGHPGITDQRAGRGFLGHGTCRMICRKTLIICDKDMRQENIGASMRRRLSRILQVARQPMAVHLRRRPRQTEAVVACAMNDSWQSLSSAIAQFRPPAAASHRSPSMCLSFPRA